MAEKKQKELTEIRNLVKERIKEAKSADTNFKDFFATLAIEHPTLKEATVYAWWQSMKDDTENPDKKTATQPTGNNSEKLAAMLRKEGQLVQKVQQAHAELATVRKQVETLWKTRTETKV
jgi:hypothetical protein